MEASEQARSKSTFRGSATSAADPLALFTTLARTSLFLEALQRECLASHGLSFPEYSVLRLLQRAPRRQLSPTALTEQIVCTTGAMTKLADRLERFEFVQRARDPHDRRGVLICLTREGSKAATAASRSYRAGRERILSKLGDREAKRIHRDLLQLLEVMETDRTES